MAATVFAVALDSEKLYREGYGVHLPADDVVEGPVSW
jgi:hypothetical protein